MATLYTIGHSNRSLEAFIEILKAHQITDVVDVRTIPRSRHMPWFNQEALTASLKKADIHYHHLPELGGLRHAKKDSLNMGWHNASFRGFADYMQTPEFYRGLKVLNLLLTSRKVVIMCAEAVPWRCHRSLIADAETIRHVHVYHIFSKTNKRIHELTNFAKVKRKTRPIQIIYSKKN